MIQIDMILMKIYNKLRNVYLTRKYGFRGNKIKYGKNVSILNPQYISVGNKVFFDDNVELCVQKTISDITPRLQIGNRVRLGKFNRIGCDNNIIIEDDVLCAPNVHISDRNHGYEDRPPSPRISTVRPPRLRSGPRSSRNCSADH